jgi:hypothetical protein
MTPSYARQIKNEMLREIGDTSNKGLKTLKRDADALTEKIDALGQLGSRINRLREPDMDIDFEIAEALGIEPGPYTGDRDSALGLFLAEPRYEVENGVEIAGNTVDCLSLQDASTNSSTKRVIRDTSETAITLALCSIGLMVRRDLLVKRLREISGYNLSPRFSVSNDPNSDSDLAEIEPYVPEQPKRRRRRSV